MDNLDFIDDENILSVPSEIDGGSFECDSSINSSIFTVSGKSSETLEKVSIGPSSKIFPDQLVTNTDNNGESKSSKTANPHQHFYRPEELNQEPSFLKSRCRWSIPHTGSYSYNDALPPRHLYHHSHGYQLPLWITGGLENQSNDNDTHEASLSNSTKPKSDSKRHYCLSNINATKIPHHLLPLAQPEGQSTSSCTASVTSSPRTLNRNNTSNKIEFFQENEPISCCAEEKPNQVPTDIVCVPINPNSGPNSNPHSIPKCKERQCRFGLEWLLLFGNFVGLGSISKSGGSCSSSKSDRRRRFLWGLLNWLVIYPIAAFGFWALIYILFGQRQAFPNGALFNLFLLEILAITLGHVFECFQLPPALGMVGAGLILRNAPISFIAIDEDMPFLPPALSNPLRALSVVILLTRGALCVSPMLIRKFWRIVPHLAVMSCVVEALVGGTAVYFLVGFPIAWAALMGCILSAMSGAIVMPYLASLSGSIGCANESGNKVIAIARTACGLDAILAICLAEFALGFIVSDGDLAMGFRKGVVEVIMGGAFGLLWGSLAGFLLGGSHTIELRTFAMFTGGTMSLLGLTTIGYPRGGPLGVFAGSLVTAIIWRHKKIDGKNNDQISANFTTMWYFFQPLLFGIIGSRTSFSSVHWTVVSKGVACLAISLTARLVTSISMCSCVPLTWRQKLFVAVTWIPKGTVQAALGPVALDTIMDSLNFPNKDHASILANQVMNIAVATIILASTVGSIALLVFGKPLLKKKTN